MKAASRGDAKMSLLFVSSISVLFQLFYFWLTKNVVLLQAAEQEVMLLPAQFQMKPILFSFLLLFLKSFWRGSRVLSVRVLTFCF